MPRLRTRPAVFDGAGAQVSQRVYARFRAT